MLVVLLALFMFVTTFLFGYLPTKIKTSAKVMNLIAIYGAGLLIGAALIVIVPEGMLVLFNSMANKKNSADHTDEDLHSDDHSNESSANNKSTT